MTTEAGELVVRIVGNGDTLERNVTGTVGRVSSSVGRMARGIGLAFGGAAVVKGVATTLNLAKNFDLTMRQVQTQTDGNAASMRELSDLALKMGQDTIYSAQEAGDAMLELAKGGLSQAQIEAGALQTALTLAAAGNLDLATSAGAVVNGLGAFNMKASESGRVATALAGAANASSADVADMTQALAQASAQANATGLEIEDAAAALAIFANNGVKGSDAGTSLKTMLQNLIPTTTTQKNLMHDLGLSFVDAHGNFVELDEIAQRLRESMGDLSQAQRVQAMRTLFGTDASRAALFLYDAGAKGVRKMTQETHNQTTVQKMANVAMSGASGAWENFTGSVETAAIRIGQKALPALTELLNWGSDMIGSADEWGPGVVDSLDGVRSAAEALWPIVKDGAQLVGDLARAWGDLPGPVQQSVVTAGLALLVLPRLQAGITSVTTSVMGNINQLRTWRTELAATETRAKVTATAIGKLSGAARTAAGVGGMVLLTESTQQTDEAFGDLMRTGGLIATGFATGGPVGAALGAVAGVAWQAHDAFKGTDTAMQNADETAANYADTLDKVTGKITQQTRELIVQQLQQDGIIASAAHLGLTTRDLVNATLGHDGAIKRVNAAYKRQHDILEALQGNKIKDWITEQGFALRNQRRDALLAASGFTTWKQALHGVPKDVQVKLRTLNFRPTRDQFKQLRREADLTPKQIRIIVKAIGYDPAVKGAKEVGDQLDHLGKKKADLTNWQRGFAEALSGTNEEVGRGVDRVNRTLDDGVRRGTDRARGTAAQGGHQTGSALGSGMYAGLQAWAGTIASQAASIVRQATIAAKHAGEIHSPSRVWRDEIGAQLARGGAEGIHLHAPDMAHAAADAVRKAQHAAIAELVDQTGSKTLATYIVKHLVGDLVGSRDDVRKAASHLADLVDNMYERRAKDRDKRRNHLQGILNGKHNDLEKQRAKRELAALKAADERDKRREHALHQLITDQQRATMKMARDWEKNHAKLQAARQAVKDLQREQADYAKSVADAMVAAANITESMPEGVAVTVASITDRMRQQVQEATQFAANIQKLIAEGLDQAYIDQLVQAGVASGAQTAIELAGATPAEIQALNDLMAQLQATGQTIGDQSSHYIYDLGIQQAQAFVGELEKNEHRIERMMRKSARSFVRELRDVLDQVKGGDQTPGKGGGKGKHEQAAKFGGGDAPLISIGAINNPAPEPASVSVATRLRRAQQTGILVPMIGANSA